MQQSSQPYLTDLVLVGGGHSHVIFLKMWAMNPLSGVRLSLVSHLVDTPYSGMLPGYIAGDYSFDAAHIDLVSLCEYAGARFINRDVQGIDTNSKEIIVQGAPPVRYDCLSLNIGSQPHLAAIEGAKEFGVPIKPVSRFLAAWQSFLDTAAGAKKQVVVVGAGAAGVETALCIKKAHPELDLHLIQKSSTILPSHNPRVQRLAEKALRFQGITFRCNTVVTKLTAGSLSLSSGGDLEVDFTIFTTHASAASWLGESDLSLDQGGFVVVNRYLQSESHPDIFAVGDVASMRGLNRPKSGVFAVRQGKPLYHNVWRYLQSRTLLPFRPQKKFLSLLNLGHTTVLSRGRIAFAHPYLAAYKTAIDGRFMGAFQNLQRPLIPAAPATPSTSPQDIRCQGCGGKVGGGILHEALGRLAASKGSLSPGVAIQKDDAAIIKLPDGVSLLQSVDHLTSFVSDPYLFGRIATNHCLSDVFAMGGQVHSVLANIIVPLAENRIMVDDIYQVLAGVVDGLQGSQARLLGGHTSEGSGLSLGLSVNGLLRDSAPLGKLGAKCGDRLILTKALGTGVILAGAMRLQTKGRWVKGAVDMMLQDNRQASLCFLKHGARACTDVTGFGLLGHLREMLAGSSLGFVLHRQQIPYLEGVAELLQKGVRSSLFPQNSQYFNQIFIENRRSTDDILVDPQTSGGLLAAVPSECGDACVEDLRKRGYPEASIIGEITPAVDGVSRILE